MKPIYFPFIDISDGMLAVVNRLFGPPRIYLPSASDISGAVARHRDSRLLETVTPVSGDEARFEGLLRQYDQWARLYEGDRGLKAVLAWPGENQIPFFDRDATSRIRAEMRRGAACGSGAQDTDALLTKARMFLHLARQYDEKDRDIAADFAAVREMEAALYRELGSDTPEAAAGGELWAGDRGEFMTAERLRAWACLFLAGPVEDQSAPACFVTDSRAVFDYLLDPFEESGRVCRVYRAGIEALPARSADAEAAPILAGIVETMACAAPGQAAPAGPDDDVPHVAEVTSCALCGRTPAEVFSVFTRSRPALPPAGPTGGGKAGTVIALLEYGTG